MQTPSSVAGRKNYDLYFRFGAAKFSWRNSAPGISLSDDAIAWTADGREQQARLSDIAEVHLQTGSVGHNMIASCRLRFHDGSTLLIASNNGSGLQDDAHDRAYCAFARDLHARLAARKDRQIAFTAGFSAARYRFGKVVIVVAALFFLVAPAVLLLITGSWQMIWALFLGVSLVWPLYRVMRADAPRIYDPQQVPPELMPTAPQFG
jgi:hypothetical protein